MIVRIISSLFLAPLFLAFVLVENSFFIAFASAVICAVAAFELLRATKTASNAWMYAFTMFAAAIIPISHLGSYAFWTVRAVAVFLVIALFCFAIGRYETPQEIKATQIMMCLFAGILIPVFFSSLVVLHCMENGRFMTLLPILTAFSTDIGAYFIGMLFGKHRGITKVSPKKSLEGFLGGIGFGGGTLLLYGVILGRFFGLDVNLVMLSLFGLIGSLITELGDLSFSLIKRQHNIKDYGNLIPGHGGMLDRFDSMIFAAPTILLLVELFPSVVI